MKERFSLGMAANIIVTEDRDVDIKVDIDIEELIEYIKEDIKNRGYSKEDLECMWDYLWDTIEDYIESEELIDDAINYKIDATDSTEFDVYDITYENIDKLIEKVKPLLFDN